MDSIQVTGHLTQNNEKIDWWKIINRNNNKEIATIEYRLVDNKVFANQYKIYRDSKLDIYRSKYYIFSPQKKEREVDENNVSYSFYTSYNKDIAKSYGHFRYFVYDLKKNIEIVNSKCECINSDNQFICTFTIPNKNNVVIFGNFWELSQTKDGKMVGSEIYVRDSLK